MQSERKALISEFLGTAVLVFVGCGAVAVGDYGQNLPLGVLPIALAFGGVLVGLIYALGPVSGCHVNPAVTIAAWIGGRFEGRRVLGYIIVQVLGAIVAAGLLAIILQGAAGGAGVATAGLGQTGWGEGYLGEYDVWAAFVVELVVTFLFVLIILGATTPGDGQPFAGIAIGLALVVFLITFVNVTGCSLNPARSIGPALFVGGKAMAQVWLFILAPMAGGLLAGGVCRAGLFDGPR